MAPLLPPIERPRGFWMRIAFAFSRAQFGKVITPLKVIYARKPALMFLARKVGETMEKKLSLEPQLRFLVQAHAARINGCTFCEDLAIAMAVAARIGKERFADLEDWRASTRFTPREKAALALVEDATRERRIRPETRTQVRAAFTEVEIVELVWLNAAENYFNLQNSVLGIESDGLARPA